MPLLTGKKHFRIPFERKSTAASTDIGAEILSHLHFLISRGKLTIDTPALRDARKLTEREYLYGKFFDGDLARHVFTEATWWKPGVWAQ